MSNVVEPGADDAPQMTPEQELELQRARKDAADAQRAALAAQQEHDAAKETRQNIQRRDAINAAIAETGIRFHAPEIVATLLANEHFLQFDAEGNGTAVVGNRRVSLTEAVKAIAQMRSYLADGRTIPSELRSAQKEKDERPKAKSELRTVQDKVAAIEKYGLQWYEALPAVPLPQTKNVAELTRQEWQRLPVHEKTRIVSELTGEGHDAAAFIARLR